jgi:hypothetical protein
VGTPVNHRQRHKFLDEWGTREPFPNTHVAGDDEGTRLLSLRKINNHMMRLGGPSPLETMKTDPSLMFDISTFQWMTARSLFLLLGSTDMRPQAADVSVRIAGMKLSREVSTFEISGEPDAADTFADPHKINIQRKRTIIDRENFNYQFPPHSITLEKLTQA